MTLEATVFFSLAERLTNQLNNLQVLKLTISGNPGKYAGNLHLFESAKSLRHLELISPMTLLINFPVSQVVSYKERSLADIKVKHMLQYGPKLKRLVHVSRTPVSNPYFLDPWIDNPRQLTSLDLRAYNVDASYTRSVDHEWSDKIVDWTPHHHFAIPSISLPHLRDIRIRDPDRNLIPSLVHLIQNSSSGPSLTITKLALCGLRCQDGQLYKLLTLTPNLTHLEYNDISTIDTILLSTKPFQVPLLQTLIIHNASSVRDFRDFVCNRNAQDSLCQPLNVVRLLYQNPDEAYRQLTQVNFGLYSTSPVLQSNILRLKALTDSYSQGAKKRSTRKESQSIFRRMLSTPQQDDNLEAFEALAELEAVVISDPFTIKLDYIHALNSFSLLRLDNGSESSGPTVSQRVQTLLDRWIAAFQLQQLLPSLAHPNSSMPRWIMIGAHCISLDGLYAYNYPSPVGEVWAKLKDVPPTEHDILYGHYRCPTMEEIFWVHKDCSYDPRLVF
ncbi:hypothetical protein BJ165DRAFT_1593042 [Panaeolus papilionaceus]|nr:hypothetical protein BJ165DRAFT_1593042 [Panaeolus papilionaceus]